MAPKLTTILWFRNNLRLQDNAPLLSALKSSECVLPLYVIDPSSPPFSLSLDKRPGPIRANFILESLTDINKKIITRGSRLMVLKGRPETILPDLVHSLSLMGSESRIFYQREDASMPLREMDRRTFAALRDREEQHKTEIVGFEGCNLHPMEKYVVRCKGNVAPSSYGSFLKLFASMGPVPQPEFSSIDEFPPLPQEMDRLEKMVGRGDVPTLSSLGYEFDVDDARKKGSFPGGEEEGLKRLKQVLKRKLWVANFEKPKTSPNALECDTTGLSPYVKHGCISPREFYHKLSEIYDAYPKHSQPPVSLHGQLLWREYNHLMAYTTPNFDKMLDNPIARQIDWSDDAKFLEAWKNARTGYPFIDAVMTQLKETGWIHHLARHAAACFLTRGDLWLSWEQGAEVFEEHLVDADWGINNFNWQWLSCTAHFYQYFRCYSPIAFGKKTDKYGEYIKKWLPMFKNYPHKYIYEPWKAPIAVQRNCGVVIGIDYPKPIVEHSIVCKQNMAKMKEAYDRHKALASGNATARVTKESVSAKRRKIFK